MIQQGNTAAEHNLCCATGPSATSFSFFKPIQHQAAQFLQKDVIYNRAIKIIQGVHLNVFTTGIH